MLLLLQSWLLQHETRRILPIIVIVERNRRKMKNF